MIYGIHRATKEHTVWPESGSLLCAVMAMDAQWNAVQADADGWIKWTGNDDANPPLPIGCAHAVKTSIGSVFYRSCPTKTNWGSNTSLEYYRPMLTEPAKPQAWVGVEPEFKIGDLVHLDNFEGNGVSHGEEAIGQRVEIKAFFMSSDIKMAAIEYDGYCYCFRASMLSSIPSHRDQWIDAASYVVHREYDNEPVAIAAAIYDALTNGTLPTPEKK